MPGVNACLCLVMRECKPNLSIAKMKSYLIFFFFFFLLFFLQSQSATAAVVHLLTKRAVRMTGAFDRGRKACAMRASVNFAIASA